MLAYSGRTDKPVQLCSIFCISYWHVQIVRFLAYMTVMCSQMTFSHILDFVLLAFPSTGIFVHHSIIHEQIVFVITSDIYPEKKKIFK